MYHQNLGKLLVIGLLALILLSCRKENPVVETRVCNTISMPTALAGTWNGAFGDSYQLTNTTFLYDWNYDSNIDQGAVAEICQYPGDNSAGFFIYQLLSAGSGNSINIGLYTVSKWKDLSSTNVRFANAYSSSKSYWFSSAEEAKNAIVLNTIGEGEFFGIFGSYTK